MADIAVVTTPTLETLTREIKYHLRLAAQSVIEVGKRLILAKELMPHGQWADWLDSNFNLKKSSAANFMSIAKRFGANFQMSGNFNQSQLVELLKLPLGDEEKFVAEMERRGTPVEKMTVKNLRGAIRKFKTPAAETAKLTADDSDTDVAACLVQLKEFNALAESLSKNPNLKAAMETLMTENDITRFKSTSANLDTLSRPFNRHIRQQNKELRERADAELIYLDFDGEG